LLRIVAHDVHHNQPAVESLPFKITRENVTNEKCS